MSVVPPHPLPLFHAQQACAGLPDKAQVRLLIASIDATIARNSYEMNPSIEAAARVLAADLHLLTVYSSIKGQPQ